MKNIITLSLILTSLSAFAQDKAPYENRLGGTLLTKDKDQAIFAVCNVYNEQNACTNFSVFQSYVYEDGRVSDGDWKLGTFAQVDNEEFLKLAKKEYKKELSETYNIVYYAGTSVGLWMFIGDEFNGVIESSPALNFLVSAPVLVVGAALDVVKAPFVFLFQRAVYSKSALTQKRFVKYMNFILDAKQKDSVKKLSESNFEALSGTFYKLNNNE